jgi:prevent-host-death family protein
MTRTIPHRELRNNSSQILRDVENGETIAISNHGDVVAYLVPPQRQTYGGLSVRKATKHGGWAELPRATLDHPVQDDIDYLRGER